MAEPTVDREEIETAIEARKELGAELEPALDGPGVPKTPAARPGVVGAKLLEP